MSIENIIFVDTDTLEQQATKTAFLCTVQNEQRSFNCLI